MKNSCFYPRKSGKKREGRGVWEGVIQEIKVVKEYTPVKEEPAVKDREGQADAD